MSLSARHPQIRRNGRNLLSLQDRDHGGDPDALCGAWGGLGARGAGLGGRPRHRSDPAAGATARAGDGFNSVSFWLCHGPAGALICVLAEAKAFLEKPESLVRCLSLRSNAKSDARCLRYFQKRCNNTFGDCHPYLCHLDDWRALGPDDALQARKIFHVSPFRPVEGHYRFRFDIRHHLDGPLLCEGVIFGPTGRVASRYVAEMQGHWQGNRGILDGRFRYAGGETQQRQWRLTLGNDGAISAEADDLQGPDRG